MDEDERLEELLNSMTSDELDEAFERAIEEEVSLEEIMSGFPHYGYIDAEMLISGSWREPDYGFIPHYNYGEEIFNLPEIPPGRVFRWFPRTAWRRRSVRPGWTYGLPVPPGRGVPPA